MSRPRRDPGEDRECYLARLSERQDQERFQRFAAKKFAGRPRPRAEPEVGIDFGAKGAWVPLRVFVSWKEAGVNPADFRDQWEDA